MFFGLSRRLFRWAVVALALFIVVPRLDGQSLAAAFSQIPVLGGIVAPYQDSSSAQEQSGQPGFTRTLTDGSPVAFPACQQVTWQFNPGPVGQEGLREAKRAVRVAERASGVDFSFVGTTSESPSSVPSSAAMVTIGWVRPDQTDALPDGISGGTIVMLDGATKGFHTGGAIALNVEHLDRFDSGSGPGGTRGALILHELGHLLGLDHSAGGLMNPVVGADSPAGFAPAERDLLASLPQCA